MKTIMKIYIDETTDEDFKFLTEQCKLLGIKYKIDVECE